MRVGSRDDDNDTIVGSNGFVRSLKQQSTNEGGEGEGRWRGQCRATMTDAGGEKHNKNNGEPMSTNGAIANSGNRTG